MLDHLLSRWKAKLFVLSPARAFPRPPILFITIWTPVGGGTRPEHIIRNPLVEA
jgi:hypothetical protein